MPIIVTNDSPGRLYVVATPIGNLADFSERARTTLASCTLIAAEDTRHTGTLLKHFGIRTPMTALHEHNEAQRVAELVMRLRAGEQMAVVSDAGTPAISDPGFGLVRAAAAAGVEICAVPGPCAAIAALSIAGLPTDRFCFEGFLPARSAARRARLTQLLHEERTLLFYESPHRVSEMLHDCAAVFGDARLAVVAREITKLHETTYRGTLSDLKRMAADDGHFARGEIVLALSGAPAAAASGAGGHGGVLDRMLGILMSELPLRQAAHLAAKISDLRENAVYKRALELRNEAPPNVPSIQE